MKPIAIADVKVGTRFRCDLGDLESLKASLADVGMLQPIGVTADAELVFGERRLEAAKALGWETVPAVTIGNLADAAAYLRIERDENACRKDWTPSELVAVGKAIEKVERAESEKRRLTNLKQNKGSTERESVPHSEGRTADKVGEALGVSGKTYEQAKRVVEEGTPELVEAMDEGKLSVKTAADVAKLPKATQRKVVKSDKPKAEAKKHVKKAKPEATETDGTEPDPREELVSQVQRLCVALDGAKARVTELAAHEFGRHIHAESVIQHIEAARKALWQSRPTEVCNCVKGDAPANEACKACFGCGRCPASRVLKGGK